MSSGLVGRPSEVGPILYIMFTADLPAVLAKHQKKVIYTLISSRDLQFWMKTNRLNLNPFKTQLIWFGTQQFLKLDHKLMPSTFPDFAFSSSVRDLGVTLDGELTFAAHISLLTQSCFY